MKANHLSTNRKQDQIKLISITGLMAALIALMTAFVAHIPVGINGGYIHFGDALIYISATILPLPYAIAAAAIGGGLADLMTAPMWIPATIIIKALIVLPFTNKPNKIVTPRNVAATIIAYLISGTGYFLAEYILFGSFSVAFITSMLTSSIQSGGSAIFFVIIGLCMDRIHVKAKLLQPS